MKENNNAVIVDGKISDGVHECKINNNSLEYIDIINYFLQKQSAIHDIFNILVKLSDFEVNYDGDMEEELYTENKDIYSKIYNRGTVICGYEYQQFLINLVEQKFGMLVRDFCNAYNPSDLFNEKIFKYYDDHGFLLFKEQAERLNNIFENYKKNFDKELLQKGGADNGNNTKEE